MGACMQLPDHAQAGCLGFTCPVVWHLRKLQRGHQRYAAGCKLKRLLLCVP